MHNNYHFLTRFFVTVTCILWATSAHADTRCVAEYERAAGPYWSIASDMMVFKTMFDNYDGLCTKNYPDILSGLTGSANILRRSTNADIKNAHVVMTRVFDEVLPKTVLQSCADDNAARDRVKKSFLSAMTTQSKTQSARLERSALTLHNPKDKLKICTELPKLEKIVTKQLGPDMNNPLFEMTKFHSKTVTHDYAQKKEAFSVWEKLLK